MTEAQKRIEYLDKALRNILNGISTGAVRVDTDQEETWANAMHNAKRALDGLPPVSLDFSNDF